MVNNPALGMLGLALRAGKLVCGEQAVHELCTAGRSRCIFLANDAGDNISKKAERYAEPSKLPVLVLPEDKIVLGRALGRKTCAVCAISDIGMAAAAVQKLAALDKSYTAVAAQLSEKNIRIQSRRGKKKADKVKTVSPSAQALSVASNDAPPLPKGEAR